MDKCEYTAAAEPGQAAQSSAPHQELLWVGPAGQCCHRVVHNHSVPGAQPQPTLLYLLCSLSIEMPKEAPKEEEEVYISTDLNTGWSLQCCWWRSVCQSIFYAAFTPCWGWAPPLPPNFIPVLHRNKQKQMFEFTLFTCLKADAVSWLWRVVLLLCF